MALLKTCCKRKIINTDGWNSEKDARNNQHELAAIDKKEMIHGGWNIREGKQYLT